MTTNLQANFEKYAELIVRTGVNIQPGQEVFMAGASIEMAELVRAIATKAYEAGASNVHVDWVDDYLSRLKYEKADEAIFGSFPSFETMKRNHFVERGAVFISLTTSSPDLLKGIPSSRISAFQKASGEGLKEFRRAIQSDKVSWTVVAGAGKEWAKKVFPDVSEEVAVDMLWNAIFDSVRLHDADPVSAWVKHNETLHEKAEVLNANKFRKLHYRAPGTDLTVELHEKHIWVAAGSTNQKGFSFMANMPTEEVFTVPLKTGTNGYVSSTKPLSYGGNIIDKFKITFENGRIVKAEAEEGEEILRKLVDIDEGSHYLGEVALVPHHSPISESGILFYNTLFDENASNHLAIGSGYAFNVEGGKTMSAEELEAHGVNASITHNDFMIGSAEMDIDGIKDDGTIVPVFRAGNWAI
ncbi:aminopeptidase [Paenibacillus agaridevorans]|uniref:aminopeptidase n=1 Tax=Paenibacillus agaridevorans TaxID=171404 RepID=UPI001BE45E33|nr:aminopeptidase [Paenibacillus agaridevorans]